MGPTASVDPPRSYGGHGLVCLPLCAPLLMPVSGRRGTKTARCSGDCSCEQKYTYHRLLAYDPDNDCRGIFIDWFLFPSCCACRCPP